MSFFDVRSSLKIPDLPAEIFEKKIVGTLRHYNIKHEKNKDGGIIFRTSMLQFGVLANRRFIFRGVSSGEIVFSNQGKDLIVHFNLLLLPTRVLLFSVTVLMIVISIVDKEYSPLIMAAWVTILYFIVRDSTRYRFRKWFSRFTK